MQIMYLRDTECRESGMIFVPIKFLFSVFTWRTKPSGQVETDQEPRGKTLDWTVKTIFPASQGLIQTVTYTLQVLKFRTQFFLAAKDSFPGFSDQQQILPLHKVFFFKHNGHMKFEENIQTVYKMAIKTIFSCGHLRVLTINLKKHMADLHVDQLCVNNWTSPSHILLPQYVTSISCIACCWTQ